MKISVNNEVIETSRDILALLAADLNLPLKGSAVAVNQKIIPREQWNSFILNDDDHVVVIRATRGG